MESLQTVLTVISESAESLKQVFFWIGSFPLLIKKEVFTPTSELFCLSSLDCHLLRQGFSFHFCILR